MILDVAKVVVAFGLMIGGFIVRFQPMPAQAVGVAMMFAGFGIAVFWERRRRARVARAASSPPRA